MRCDDIINDVRNESRGCSNKSRELNEKDTPEDVFFQIKIALLLKFAYVNYKELKVS